MPLDGFFLYIAECYDRDVSFIHEMQLSHTVVRGGVPADRNHADRSSAIVFRLAYVLQDFLAGEVLRPARV